MWFIGDVAIKNKVVIAPMAGVSNIAFREICFTMNAGLVYSEMVSDKAIAFNSKKTIEMCEVGEKEHPLTLQLFGYDIDTMVSSAMYLDQHTNCDIIDINMGCPVPKVIKAKAGSYLMCEEEHAVKMVEAIVKAVKKPVTVKMRTGWTKDTMNCVSLATSLEKVGVKAIAVHGRTRGQLYMGEADWSMIKKVKDAVSIPVIGNGDVRSSSDALRMLSETGCDAIMIGRASIGNPFLIQEIVSVLNNEPFTTPTPRERANMALLHASQLSSLQGEYIAIKQMRGLASWYIQGLPFSAPVKNKMNTINTINDLKIILDEYLLFLENN